LEIVAFLNADSGILSRGQFSHVLPGLVPGIHAEPPPPTSRVLATAPRGWPGQARPRRRGSCNAKTPPADEPNIHTTCDRNSEMSRKCFSKTEFAAPSEPPRIPSAPFAFLAPRGENDRERIPSLFAWRSEGARGIQSQGSPLGDRRRRRALRARP
jgi:hypothetical protein